MKIKKWNYYVTGSEIEIRSGAEVDSLVAIVNSNTADDAELHAQLIAAAPEMLEAMLFLLKDTLKVGGSLLSMHADMRIRKAIAEAEGQSK